MLHAHEQEAEHNYSNDTLYHRMVSESLHAISMGSSAMKVGFAVAAPSLLLTVFV